MLGCYWVLVVVQPAFQRFMDEVLAVFTAEAGGVPDAGEGGRRQGDGERDVSVRLFPVLLQVFASLHRAGVLPEGVIKRRDVAAIYGVIGQCRQLGKGFAIGFAQGRQVAGLDSNHAHSGIPRFWLLCGR